MTLWLRLVLRCHGRHRWTGHYVARREASDGPVVAVGVWCGRCTKDKHYRIEPRESA